MKEHDSHYRHLGVMAALSFVAMYLLMYAMVNSVENVYMNVNQVYMAGLMTAPMVIIELLVMRGMYYDKKRNAAIIGASAIVGIVLFMFIQAQTGVSDRQFLRSMIPRSDGCSAAARSSWASGLVIRRRARSDGPATLGMVPVHRHTSFPGRHQ